MDCSQSSLHDIYVFEITGRIQENNWSKNGFQTQIPKSREYNSVEKLISAGTHTMLIRKK